MDDLDPQARDTERVLAAVDRIRLERDGLRRNLEWVKIENKFEVDTLQAQLTRAQHRLTSASFGMKSTQRGACVAVLVTRYLLSQCDAFDLEARALTASREDIYRNPMDVEGKEQAARSRVRELEEENTRLRDSLASCQSRYAGAETELAEMKIRMIAVEEVGKDAEERAVRLQGERDIFQQELLISHDHLQTAEFRVSEFTNRIATLEDDVVRERTSHQATGAALAQAEDQIVELGASVDNAESSRDSLALEITHLTQDLATARQELEDTEARYNELQTQQLASMSSSEVTRTLRQKIEDLEYRVQHRTEQVGLHQHDIKRLETNMRLQEERIAEMTSDLEVLQGEKATMIEDCNTTREERDEALQRYEELEQRMEVLEEGTSRVEADRDVEMHAVVKLVFQEKAARRHLSHRLVSAWTTHAERVSRLEAGMREAENFKSRTLQQIEHLDHEAVVAARLIEEKVAELDSLRNERDVAVSHAREATSALDTLRTELDSVTSSLADAQGHESVVQSEVSQLQAQLDDKVTETAELESQYRSLRAQYDETKASLISQVSDLEAEIHSLQDANVDNDARREHAEKEISRLTEELHAYRSSGTESALLLERLRSELQQARASHLEEAGSLRAEVTQARVDLEEARQFSVEIQATHKLALERLTQVKKDLETKLTEATDQLQSSNGTQAELIDLQDRYASETKAFQERLDRVSSQVEAARSELQEQAAHSDETIRQLEERLCGASEVLHAKEDLEMEIGQLRAQHEAETKILERRIADFTSEESATKRSLSDLEMRCQTLGQEKSDLEDSIARMTTDVDQLQDQLRVLSENHDLTLERHSVELKGSIEIAEESQHARNELTEQLTLLRQQFQETQSLVDTLEEEKRQLQSDRTQAEAEIQRSLSLQRFQESHLKDSEREILSVRAQLEQARTEVAEAERAAKAAEINMELQSVQHEKTLLSLRREVSSLRERSKLEGTVAELTERNSEMEQLLQAKCLEIEENDDRVIELLKGKKRLTSKIDNLTKKVQILQAKLSTGSTPAGDSTPSQSQAQRASTSKSPHLTPLAPLASSSRTPMPPTPLTPNSRRIASGTTLPRPKTPDTRVPPPPVFKARTPESKRTQPKAQSQRPPPPPPVIVVPSSSSLGKKRRAPDDFEDCESLPPQVFTVDSVPSQETENAQSTTPRVRRALQAVRSGFTPVRSHSAQQPTHTVLTSPARRATTGASLIADVTNSPRGPSAGANAADDKAGKRGWLGKIRGGPGQSNGPRSVSSRASVFDRQVSSGSSR